MFIFMCLFLIQQSWQQSTTPQSNAKLGKTMRAVFVRQYGGPEVLKVEDLPIPAPQPNEVLIRVHAAGVNPVDLHIRSGQFRVTKLPYVPGMDGAGVVEEVGTNVTRFKKGDRVFVVAKKGTYAQYVSVPKNLVFYLPSNLSFSQGAAIGIGYFTSYRALFQTPKGKHPRTVLVHGASGGVGLAAVQLAKRAGLKVIGTASSEQGEQLVKRAGADYVFDHRNGTELKNNIKKLGAVDLILEMVANVNLPIDLEIISPKGTIVVIGTLGPATIDPGQLLATEASIVGISTNKMTEHELFTAGEVIEKGLENGSLVPYVDKEYPLTNVAEAQNDISKHTGASGSKGKLILLTDE